MSENNFPHDRAQQEAPPLFLGELPEGGRAQLAPEEIPPLTANSPAHSPGDDLPQTTNLVSEQGDAGTISDASRPDEHSVPAKEPPLPAKSRYDRKFVYPGSGVHYLREHKDPAPPLSKEEYDALFRPHEHKKKPRNDIW
jgi:hypothetical protein